MALISPGARDRAARRAGHELHGARRGQHAHAADRGDEEQKDALAAPAGRRRDPLVLRDDRAGRRVERPHQLGDDRRQVRRRDRVHHQRAQVVHHRRQRRGVRDRRGQDRRRRDARAPQLQPDPRPHRHARLGGRARPGVDGLALARRAPDHQPQQRPRAGGQPARRRGRGLRDRAEAPRGRPPRARDALDRHGPARARPRHDAPADAQVVRQGAGAPPDAAGDDRRLRDGPLRVAA